MRFRALFSFLVIVLVLLSSSAFAQGRGKPPAEDPAAAAKRQGDEAMDGLRYDEAIAAYTRAYEINGMPAAIYNRGRVHQARAEYVAALSDIEKFAAEAPADLRAKVPELDALLTELRGKVARITVACNVDGARVLVRGVQIGTTPIVKPIALNAGKADVEVLADGRVPWRSSVDLAGGKETPIMASLVSSATTGMLSVRASGVAGAVTIDGKPAGNAPLEIELPIGTHRILMQREGYEDASTSAVVAAAERRDVVLGLEKSPGLFSKWWFWTGVGVIVTAGVITTVALLTERGPDTGDGFTPDQVRAPLVKW